MISPNYSDAWEILGNFNCFFFYILLHVEKQSNLMDVNYNCLSIVLIYLKLWNQTQFISNYIISNSSGNERLGEISFCERDLAERDNFRSNKMAESEHCWYHPWLLVRSWHQYGCQLPGTPFSVYKRVF